MINQRISANTPIPRGVTVTISVPVTTKVLVDEWLDDDDTLTLTQLVERITGETHPASAVWRLYEKLKDGGYVFEDGGLEPSAEAWVRLPRSSGGVFPAIVLFQWAGGAVYNPDLFVPDFVKEN